MADILIRDLDVKIVAALRQRAAERGTSREEEARRVLAASVDLTREAAVALLTADEAFARAARAHPVYAGAAMVL